MRKILKILYSPITWILVSIGVLVAKKVVIALAANSNTIAPTAGDELPDDEAPL